MKIARRGGGWVALGLGLLATLAWLIRPGLGRSVTGSVPTLTLAPEELVLTVNAEGVLKAVETIPLLVPPDAPTPARLAWMVDDGSPVEAGQVVVRFDPTDLEKERDEVATELARSRLELARQRSESDATLENLGRDARSAELEAEMSARFGPKDEELYSRAERIEAEIDTDLARLRLENARSAHQTQEKLARFERELLGLKLRQGEVRLARTEDGLRSLEVVAPFGGLLALSRGWRGEMPKVGDTVWPGQPIGEIPRLDEMAAEVFVLEADAGSLRVGQRATLVVEAHPETSFAATVERVGTLAQPRIPGSPVQYFDVGLKLETTDSERMKPGGRVRARLELERLSGALMVPRQAIFEHEGKTVLFRRERGRFEPVEVKLGAGGPGRVAVEGLAAQGLAAQGLAAGDEIALVDPRAAERPPAEPPPGGEEASPAAAGGGS